MCGGVWRYVEVCGGVWRCVEVYMCEVQQIVWMWRGGGVVKRHLNTA